MMPIINLDTAFNAFTMDRKEEKKRKRQSNGLGTPNKKLAVAEANANVQIRVSLHDRQSRYPAVVSTSGLRTPSGGFQSFVRQKAQNKDEKIHPTAYDLLLQSSEHPRLDYTATSSTAIEELSHYIAVYDPSINDVQLIPAHHLDLHSTLRSEARDVARDELSRTFAQRREQLGKEFGTKKAQKAIADKTVNAINQNAKGKGKQDDVQMAVLEAIDKTVSEHPSLGETVTDRLATKPIPQPNLEAESVEDVYPLKTLVPPVAMRLLDLTEWQEKGKEEDPEFKSRFVGNRFKQVFKSGDVARLKALQYLAVLIDFFWALQKGRKGMGRVVPKKDILANKMSGWSPELIDSVRRRFSDADNGLPKWHLDNLITHICAIALFVDGYSTLITQLRNDFNLDNKQMSSYYQELGCKVSALTEKDRSRFDLSKAEAAATRVARLKLPLDFPKPRMIRRR